MLTLGQWAGCWPQPLPGSRLQPRPQGQPQAGGSASGPPSGRPVATPRSCPSAEGPCGDRGDTGHRHPLLPPRHPLSYFFRGTHPPLSLGKQRGLSGVARAAAAAQGQGSRARGAAALLARPVAALPSPPGRHACCPVSPQTLPGDVHAESQSGSNSWLMVTSCSLVTSDTMTVDLRRSSMCTDRHSPAGSETTDCPRALSGAHVRQSRHTPHALAHGRHPAAVGARDRRRHPAAHAASQQLRRGGPCAPDTADVGPSHSGTPQAAAVTTGLWDAA